MPATAAALGSALLVALASVLQHRAGTRIGAARLRHVLRHLCWIWGATAGLAGFALHVLSLSTGALSVVQPLLVTGLLFALPLGRALDHRKIRLADIAAAGAVVGGLSLFQATARPSAGHLLASMGALGASLAVVAVAVAVVLAWSRRVGRNRAVTLGLATGAAYGMVAALLKASLGILAAHGLMAMLTSWPVYAFAVLVGAAIVVNQLAFNAGPLSQSLPLITIVDPLVSIAVGAIAFHELVTSVPSMIAGQVLGFTAMSVGVAFLARRAEPTGVPAKPQQDSVDCCSADQTASDHATLSMAG